MTRIAIGTVQIQTDGQGCVACGNAPVAFGGGVVANREGVYFQVALGRAPGGFSAGLMQINASEPMAGLGTPAAWTVMPSGQGVTPIQWLDTLRQVKVPEGLVDLVALDNNAYALRCYYNADLTVPSETSPLYGISSTAVPFHSWAVTNIIGSQSAELRLTESVDTNGAGRSFRYAWSATNKSWDLLQPDGLTHSVTYASNVSTNAALTNFIQEDYFGTNLISRTRKLQSVSPGGGTNLFDTDYPVARILEEEHGAGALTELTQYAYYPDTLTNGSAGRLCRVVYPTGDWRYYTYDELGRQVGEYAPEGDTAVPAVGTTPDVAADRCRLTEFAYVGTAGDGFDGQSNRNPFTPCRTRVFRPGQDNGGWTAQEVARSYHLEFTPEYEQDITCPAPGYSAYDGRNLVTTTWRDSAGQVQAVLQPDGTGTTYAYLTNEVGFATNVVAATGPLGGGMVSSGTLMETVFDPLGRTLTSQTYALAEGQPGPLLSAQSYFYFGDPLLRSYSVVDLAGRTNTYQYGCCGLEATTDPEGVQTVYAYDVLKRQTGTTRLAGTQPAIRTTNFLDTAGRVVMSQRQAGGTTVTLDQSEYNALGRLCRQTNALGGVTTYAEEAGSNGHWLKTVTYPDGGTQVEEFYRDGRLYRRTGTAVFPVQYGYGTEPVGEVWCELTQTTQLDTNGTPTSEWTKAYTDAAGRPCRTVHPDGSYEETTYNSLGQVATQRDADGITTEFAYNAQGESTTTRIGGRVFTTETAVATNHNEAVRATRRYAGEGAARVLLSQYEASVDGLRTWNTVYPQPEMGVESRSVTVWAGAGTHYVTNTAAGGARDVSAFQFGRLLSTTRQDTNGNALGQTSYTYDAHGRVEGVTDPRNGATTYGYYPQSDLLQTVTTPDPDGNGPATTQTTTSYYNATLQVTNVLQPDGTSVFTSYQPNGLRQRTWGSRVYPVAYTYDHAGRMQTMTTWQEFNPATGQGVSGAATTSWHYDAQRGWLTNKAYADGLGTTYSNTPAGRLARRDWARGVSTAYTYGDAGDLATVTYSDGTPTVSYSYDGQGHQITSTQGDTTVTRLFDNVGNLLSEGYTGGPLTGLTVTNSYDAALRRTNLALLNPEAAVLFSQSYGYDSAARLAQVTAGGATATYGYLANSPLVEHLWFTNNGAWRMTTTRQYDYQNRLTRIASASAAAPEVSFAYAYNAANQRTALTNADNAYWVYSYDALGQVTSGKKYWADGTLVAGQQFEYTFDDIGNRKTARAGGDLFGENLRLAEYYPNSLNQYASNTVPGWVPVLGQANSNATVTLWADNGAYAQTDRKGDYYRGELAVTNHSGPVWLTLTNLAVLRQSTNADIVSSATGRVLVAQSPQAFTHDFDGNLTSDGLWTNTWNAENRRVSVESRATVPPAARAREDWTFLPDGRWIERLVSTNDGSNYHPSATNRFVWDGQVLVAVLDHTNGLMLSFTRGLDLSGTVNGAGGAGGLLWVSASASGSHAAVYDGNGNVMGLVNLADGTESARYEYGPFGEPLRQSGPIASTNPLRFSTQYADAATGDTKYLFRDYKPCMGRWLSRDPIDEQGGVNLYGFVGNDSVRFIDSLGLWKSGVWGTQHKDLTVNALNTALARQNLSEACKSKMRDILVDANEGQDKDAAANEMFRHFNRKYNKGETPQEVAQRRASARQEYAAYTMGEEISFYYIPDCWERLKALGRMSHSWQDYYAHGIHTSRGFVDPIGGFPTSFGEFWPSSYNAWNAWGSGEHPNRAEPVEVSSRRYQQAEAYTALRFRKMIENWLASCKCFCP